MLFYFVPTIDVKWFAETWHYQRSVLGGLSILAVLRDLRRLRIVASFCCFAPQSLCVYKALTHCQAWNTPRIEASRIQRRIFFGGG